MSKEMWSQLKKFSDGDNLDARTLNIPISQLGERTAYLYSKLKEWQDSGVMSCVVLTDVALSSSNGEEPDEGNAVYIDQERRVVSKAKATMSMDDDFSAAESAFSIGILSRKEGDKGDVIVYGNMSLNPSGSPMPIHRMIETGEKFRPGRYYLSANEAGKLTSHPNGPRIYICSIGADASDSVFTNGVALINPQFLDMGTSHIHRTAVLTARPAGTLSVSGYLPNRYVDDDNNVDPNALSLRFGGTWTSDAPVYYRFYLSNDTANWPNGVVLYWNEWRENESKARGGHVTIPGPDVEVAISNGLTARLSLPESTNSVAYNVTGEDERSWPVLVFPEAGKGWLSHEPMAIADLHEAEASQSATADAMPHVAIRGRVKDAPMEASVYFPSQAQVLLVGSIEYGSEFGYSGNTYVFTLDTDSYESQNGEIPVQIGPCKADSVHNLAKELDKTGSGKFAVLESSNGEDATLVAIDADEISEGGIVSSRTLVEGADYTVPGNAPQNMKMIACDANGWILGTSAVVENVKSYMWSDIGNGFSVMVFQDVVDGGNSATIPRGSVFSCVLEDEEPGAVYDYAIGFEQYVSNYWPPVPAKSAALIVNGVEMDNKSLLPANPTVSFGRRTIHWFEDSVGRRPWPEAFVMRGEPIYPYADKTEVMHWVRGLQGATGSVTSLQVKAGSPFKIVGFGSDSTANTGDLVITGDFDFDMVNRNAPGYLVPKRARNGKLIAGPVVERLIGGPGVSVVSQDGGPSGQGTVIIALDNGSYHSAFSDVALENAEQAKIGMFPYIRLKGYSGHIASPSAFTATMRVPTNLPDGKYFLRLQASVFGENGFSGVSKRFACVKFSYNILPDYRVSDEMAYRNLKSTLLRPDGERTVIIPFGHGDGSIEYNGFDPVIIGTDDASHTDKDDVVSNVLGDRVPCDSDFNHQNISPYLRPGYLVGIRISRAETPSGEGEAYTGPIGFINLDWSLVSESSWASRISDTVAEELADMRRDLSGKVSKTALEGVEVNSGTIAGIKGGVEAVGEVLGATVVK